MRDNEPWNPSVDIEKEAFLWMTEFLKRNSIALVGLLGTLLFGYGLETTVPGGTNAILIVNGIYLAALGLIYQFRYLDAAPGSDCNLRIRFPYLALWVTGGVLAGHAWGSVTITVGVMVLAVAVLMMLIATANSNRTKEQGRKEEFD